ncbi:hypothetical protein HBI56_103740 [Parastagonospora nodorum]|uniref:Uncharacterized protein n=1 Tax=Phaeosphaeria nodorum (strain SN15 / ATCC MYA-4574 / FGSC 10173) TaxID=321614 RepID=A0A7U2FC91_PHANO|nr:hypothetical protein HBH56_135150 [Parastagonospora nodorum]QRD02609.1 hypothetical protein JI435_441100 [Parastagonospora nodorum SN15]KAH3926861.1 hypothetical protein HBH54_158140 [Parastagonospora nodorum]KAH3949426.1 hypothetical protein HBH53_090240 [Parastagonospora nodorum]KAH3958891.1 hypothetical protein HBH51_205360 [Parastagonospora nodorum]
MRPTCRQMDLPSKSRFGSRCTLERCALYMKKSCVESSQARAANHSARGNREEFRTADTVKATRRVRGERKNGEHQLMKHGGRLALIIGRTSPPGARPLGRPQKHAVHPDQQ